MKKIARGLKTAAPYLAVELLLPGGTLLALLMWLAQRRKAMA
jgi:hypothetical protein